MGYKKDDFLFGLNFEQKKASHWNNFLGQLSLGFVYTGINNTKIGIEHQMQTSNL